MPLPKDQAWFAAKTHGWGWGLPLRWQGWVALGAFLTVFTTGSIVFAPVKHPVLFVAWIAGSSATLLAICWWKGEKTRWRWGEE